MTTRKLEGKIALITGTGGGQGRAAAKIFAAAGAQVFGCDIGEGNAQTAEIVKAAGGSFTGLDGIDLGDQDAARGWIDEVAKTTGHIDIVYNNASAARFAPIGEFPIDDWLFTIRNELHLVFYVTRFAWPYLQKRGGVVLNVGSISGIAGSTSGSAAHSATKGAVIALTRQLAAEGSKDGIRAVALSPGVIETPGTAAILSDPALAQGLLAGNMIKRFGTAEEVAQFALFLASDDAAYVTGANMVIDGGATSW